MRKAKTMRKPQRHRLVTALMMLALAATGCASADVSDDGGAVEAPTASTGADDPVTAAPTNASEVWGDDLAGAALCATVSAADIESTIGAGLGEEPNPVDSEDSATCVLVFEDGSSVDVVVWPESVWEGRSPSDAYTYKYEIDAGPAGTIVTELDDVGIRAAMFEIPDVDAISVLVQTESRVFVVVTADLEGEQLSGLARVLAGSL